MTEESEVKARWAGYFERLYQADPPAVELDVTVTIPISDPPINCDPPSFVETQAGNCVWKRLWKLLKAGRNAALMSAIVTEG